MEMKATNEANQTKRKKPVWLKWLIRLLLAYLLILAIILSATIIILLGTFVLVIVDTFTDVAGLQEFTETNLVPITNWLWNLFIWLIPGL
ncbi:hypothetical protein [Alkalicoccobacillus porphyridii]|uniref:Uncharacterized protein n=1 Tax=Alkalicoccobacillus porphyridii TaxID=2597270 RepID=A0A553ZZV3_9BACI|nr:hypothetical protein [Alkalicoccobacillus porphyridii]TSB46978.1 hypothetical protein FN960_08130 [Alkalicoccobacillus porphyridii]